MREEGLGLVLGGALLGASTAGGVIAAIGFWQAEAASANRWWNDSILATWGQTVGTLMAVAVAVGVPMVMRHLDLKREIQDKWNESNIVVALNSAKMSSNREFLRTAITGLTKVANGSAVIWWHEKEVREAFLAMKSIESDDIKVISYSNEKLALLLAEQKNKLEKLQGILSLNMETPIKFSYLLATFDKYAMELQSIDDKIQTETVF